MARLITIALTLAFAARAGAHEAHVASTMWTTPDDDAACTSDASGLVNCYTGSAGGTWFAEPASGTWYLQSFPEYPQEAHASKNVVLSREARGAAEVLDLGEDGVLDIAWDAVLELGPEQCRHGECEPNG